MDSRSFFSFFLFLAIATTSRSLPFVFFHGLVDECSSHVSIGIVSHLKDAAQVKGQCLEIGNGRHDSIHMPMLDQIQIACDKVKELEYLKGGFNIFAVSQGALIGRGLIEFCDGAPPVKNFVSLAGPHAGVAAIPQCQKLFNDCCSTVQSSLDKVVYLDFVQDLATPATYYKAPKKILFYWLGSKFLPKLNNELKRNSTYKERFESLENLVLLMNEDDDLLVPKETAQFGYYRDGSDIDHEKPIPAQETRLYIEDWIGLKNLTESGRVSNVTVPGGHADARFETLDTYVVPYLADDPAITSKLKLKLHNKA